jgi:hypothetical protein
MTKFVFKRNSDGEFDLSEAALRRVVGDVQINGAMTVHWPLGSACEDLFLSEAQRLMFEQNRSYEDAAAYLFSTRPIMARLSRIDRVARDDDADFEVEGST